MRPAMGVTKWIVSAALVLCIAGTAVLAQDPDDQVTSAKCDELQQQMDRIMAVYNSPTMSDAEKMKSLTQIWMQAVAAMVKSTSQDSDMSEIAHEWKDTLEKLMGIGKASGDASTGLKMVKKRIEPYLQLMKTVCPNLRIPDVVTK